MTVEARSETKVLDDINIDDIKEKRNAIITLYKELNSQLPEKERLNNDEMKIIRSSLFNTLATGFPVKDFKTLYNEIKTGVFSSSENYEIKKLNLIDGDDQNLLFGWGSTVGSFYNIDGKIDYDSFINLFPKYDRNNKLKLDKINNMFNKIKERYEDKEAEHEKIVEIYKRIRDKNNSKNIKISNKSPKTLNDK